MYHTCRQMATLTLHPKEVETALGLSPRAENSFENDVERLILGLSSATTTQVRTQDRLTPRCLSVLTEDPSPLVHSSITPYEQKVSLTRYWLTALNHRAGFSSTSEGGIKIE
jgi:hypothetical protein